VHCPEGDLTSEPDGEVVDAGWEKFDLNRALWTVLANRMKAGKEHRVPLSDRALSIIRELGKTRVGDFVFTSFRGASRRY
jgi:integrase